MKPVSLVPVASLFHLAVAILAGCERPPDRLPPKAELTLPSAAAVVDLDAVLARAAEAGRPVAVFIFEPGAGDAANTLQASFRASLSKGKREGVVPVVIDLSVSRNRATAARFHLADAVLPRLLCLSSKGVIVSADSPPLDFARRFAELAERGPQLDAKLAALEAVVAEKPQDATAQLTLADFLQAQGNAREAIPHLAAVAHLATADPQLRVRAWVDLARAHLWIAEPEKARHEASDLMAALGPRTPVAIAGGNLVHGLQDAKGKRTALARREFNAAVAAAPQSKFGREAAVELAKIPPEDK